MGLTLITGGARSGKSRYAMSEAEKHPGSRLFIATAPRSDDDMKRRIARHQEERNPKHWATLEVEFELAERIKNISEGYSAVVVDCITLWLSNLLLREPELDETAICQYAADLISSIDERNIETYLVSNEVGMSVHPATELGRRFQDVQGRMNQELAKAADRVVLMVSGIPMILKASS